MGVNKHIVNLLNILSLTREDLRWKVNCGYSNGNGNTLMEIKIQEVTTGRNKGHMAYCQEDDKVVNFRYRGLNSRKQGNIVDTLLDVINYEKQT